MNIALFVAGAALWTTGATTHAYHLFLISGLLFAAGAVRVYIGATQRK